MNDVQYKVGDLVVWYNPDSRLYFGVEIVTKVGDLVVYTDKTGDSGAIDSRYRKATPVQIAKYRCENE